MTESVSDINLAIRLLRELIEHSPASSQDRLRLLTLLYDNRRKHEFVEEAFTYAANCDLTVDTDWEIICKMGRSIDPENSFFVKLSTINTQEFRYSQPPTSQPEENLDTDCKSTRGPVSPEGQPGHDAKSEVVECETPESRKLSDRRKEDRRKQIAVWCGEDRRKQVRRQRRRGSCDQKRHRGK